MIHPPFHYVGDFILMPLLWFQTYADGQRLIYLPHSAAAQRPDIFPQSSFVDGSYLFQQNVRIPPQPLLRLYPAMSGHSVFVVRPACDDGRYDSAAMLIADIIADKQYRSVSKLLRTDTRH
jgi:hypothetical protein